ncbi:hypothetical protein V1264_010608 [Littorina saxatilis]|uniref:Uncharacterized protein n=1 Tax=Littorina saxatilis TaxID=31220 RepID=A0AAN9AQG0_9CAEN
MSSCSDVEDQFYDAEDKTPSTSFVQSQRTPAGATSGMPSDSMDLEEEEKQLLELKRRAEERFVVLG